jgi:hypothetical protein
LQIFVRPGSGITANRPSGPELEYKPDKGVCAYWTVLGHTYDRHKTYIECTPDVHQMYTVHTLATYAFPNLCVAHLPCSVMPSRARTRGGAAVNGNLAFFRMAKGGGRARTCGLPGVDSGGQFRVGDSAVRAMGLGARLGK